MRNYNFESGNLYVFFNKDKSNGLPISDYRGLREWLRKDSSNKIKMIDNWHLTINEAKYIFRLVQVKNHYWYVFKLQNWYILFTKFKLNNGIHLLEEFEAAIENKLDKDESKERFKNNPYLADIKFKKGKK